VLARVQKIAGPSNTTGAPLSATATITQQSDHTFHLQLAIRSGDLAAERNIDGKSCKDLAGAAAVALALLLSSGEPLNERDLAGSSSNGQAADLPNSPGQEPPGPRTSAAAAAPPPESPEPSEPTRPTPDGSERAEHGVLVAPLVALGFGPTRGTARGLGLGAGLFLGGWEVLAEGKLWASQRATVTHLKDDYDVDLHRFTVGVRACRRLSSARVELAPCMSMSVQHLSVRGSGPNLVPQTDSASWLAAGVGARARLKVVPWFGLIAGIDGELEFSRPEIALKGVGSVQRLAPAAATITFGSEWIF